MSRPAQNLADACLRIANLQHPWLLVLDNADDPMTDYQNYLPAGHMGVIIITSRNDDCQQYASIKPITLEGLAGKDAEELLLKAAHVPQDYHTTFQKESRSVAALLQSHPLALIQAGTYISRGHCTIAEYPSIYERQRQRLLAFRPTQAQSRYRDVYATFEASAEILKQSENQAAQDALQVLPLLAFCWFDRIPLHIFKAAWKRAKPVVQGTEGEDEHKMAFTQWHIDRLLPLMCIEKAEWDHYRLVEATQLLKSFALVSVDHDNDWLSVSMHPLIHAWARDRQDESVQHENWLRMICLMALSRRHRSSNRRSELQLQPHVEAVVGSGFEKSPIQAPLLVALENCAWMLHKMRSDTKLVALLDTVFRQAQLSPTKVDPDWFTLYELAARNLHDCGKGEESIHLAQQLVRVSNPRHRPASQHILATAYRTNGLVMQAVEIFEQIVESESRSLREDDPDRLASQHELGAAYLANGQVNKAIKLLEHVVRVQKRSWADDHANHLASQHQLAKAYRMNHQLDQALKLLEHVLEMQKQFMAETHPDYLITQFTTSLCLWDLGETQSSFEMMKKVDELQRQVLDPNHPDRLASNAAMEVMKQVLEKHPNDPPKSRAITLDRDKRKDDLLERERSREATYSYV